MYKYTQACMQGPDQRPFLPGSQIGSGGEGVSDGLEQGWHLVKIQ